MSSTSLPSVDFSNNILLVSAYTNDSSMPNDSLQPTLATGNSTVQIESYLLYKVAFYMSKYYMWVILALGLPGNLASIYTILSMPTVSSSKAHVAILALTDSIAIISKISYHRISEHRAMLTGPGCAILMFVQQFSSTYPNWIVVAMTTERFLAVWFPLRVGRMYTRRKALIVLACLALVTTAFYLFLFWVFTEEYNEDYGYWCTARNEYQEFMTETFYWMDGFYFAIIPCSLIFIGNALIITNIKRARKAQRHLTNAFDQGGRKARDQRQITIMLVVVSVVFLLLNIPNAVFYMVKPKWQKSIEPNSYESVKYQFTARLIHVLTDTNHAVNFYLYFLSMATFRRRFLDAVRCRGRKTRRLAGSSVYRTSQTYMHSMHNNSSDTMRPDANTAGYSAYKRANHHPNDNVHCLKSYPSNNNRSSNSPCHLDSHSALTASSEV